MGCIVLKFQSFKYSTVFEPRFRDREVEQHFQTLWTRWKEPLLSRVDYGRPLAPTQAEVARRDLKAYLAHRLTFTTRFPSPEAAQQFKANQNFM